MNRPVQKCIAAFSILSLQAFASPQEIALTVPAGVPLHVYVTKRFPKKEGAPVQAKLLAPVFAYDKEVIPAGVEVIGHVSRLTPVSRCERWRAIFGGDFTPLHRADVEFTSVRYPDGHELELHATQSTGLNSLYNPWAAKKRAGAPVNGTQAIRNQINEQMARVRSIPDIVRGPEKKDLFYDFALSKLPYHPQFVRGRTRYDAELSQPINFGSETLSADAAASIGSQPDMGSIAHARLVTPIDSSTSKPGQKIQAVLSEPLFSSDHKLILPEGTIVSGSVVLSKKAGWLHRSGRLRFNFQSVDLPSQVAREGFRTEASLSAAESDGAPFQVDKEGGVQARESKVRFLSLAAAMLITRSASDNDATRNTANNSGAAPRQNSNVAGRTLGGGLGFGVLGSIAAQITPSVGTGLGYYGMAWSLYYNLIARGAEVQFPHNAVIDISFNQRPVLDSMGKQALQDTGKW